MHNPLHLGGRTILVTGASAGIGKSTAVLLSQLGAQVVLLARNQAKLEETAALLEVSEATVLRDWRAAKAWLAHELRPAG